ncbi:hypothetical protein JMJ56_28100 [Belnapia sp. T18]|uniref:Uncharacterized protein n=1 Tax=Belnapia arida TaxID=2804533 RepID=A0ABS1UAY9_9PROT|nr:hypothetical protein [Belnapia arida]MBL6081852.1 hypothetical protein [Belnapia arida]
MGKVEAPRARPNRNPNIGGSSYGYLCPYHHRPRRQKTTQRYPSRAHPDFRQAGRDLLRRRRHRRPVLRIPASTGWADIEAAVAALVDLLDRMGTPLQDSEPAETSPLAVRSDASFQGITPSADQVRAAYLRNGDRMPANLRTGLARAFFG